MGPFDYVIVGAGSAGCVLANRLSADPKHRVLVIEAGPEPTDPWIKIPAGMAKLFAPGPRNFAYLTEPEPHLAGRRVYWPRGRGLGGSSAINGMLYVRGHPLDFEHWRQLGNPGWGWDDVLPLFRKSERNQRGESATRGGGGELAVSDPVMRHSFPKLFIQASVEEGFAETDDFNGGDQDGVGFLQFTIKNGQRCSAYEAFVKPVRGRPNLMILTDAAAERVVIEHGRATGVWLRHGGGRHLAECRGEVILAGGTINSPQLLMLSGVGPAAHLQGLGIDVVRDLPGVGENLHDHMYANLVYRAPRRHSVNHKITGARAYLEGARYLATRTGVLTNGTSQTSLFARVTPGAEQPDVQINTRPLSFAPIPGGGIAVRPEPTVTVSICQLRPESRGRITLRTADIADAPKIEPHYFESTVDQQVLTAGVRLAQKIMARPLIQDQGFEPVYDVPDDDAGLLAYLRGVTGPVYHPVGTCRMGPDPMAVVGADLKVHGVEGLRVADASIMPAIISGNTNAPAIMIGEKASELILAARR
ncbi:MAG TPA: GMC family oxidoreductase N-terminal domain-containing protein [Caulobacteraceae bacterium]|jgi:choline dehydrogenase